MGKAAAAKIGSSLVARKLMRESRSKPGMPVWREAEGKNISLVITRAGRDAIGCEVAWNKNPALGMICIQSGPRS
jgi:acyl-CoA reductase-like NAD-dependent aldehyde dehydrogenase